MEPFERYRANQHIQRKFNLEEENCCYCGGFDSVRLDSIWRHASYVLSQEDFLASGVRYFHWLLGFKAWYLENIDLIIYHFVSFKLMKYYIGYPIT